MRPKTLLLLAAGAVVTGALVAGALLTTRRATEEPAAIAIRTVPVPLDPTDATAERVGALRYRAGFHLTSDRRAFGGFSGLVVIGNRLTAVSDEGYWLTAELRLAADGTLLGLDAGEMGELRDDDGIPAADKHRRDAEELVALPGRGLLVSLEHDHRIVLYADSGDGPTPLAGPPRPFPFPPEIATAELNKGMEAVAVLADGRLLAFAEDLRTDEGDLRGWIADPARADWRPLTLEASGDLSPTGAAALPSGDVLLLERSYHPETGNRIRLSLLAAAALAPGARLSPRELARLAPPLTVDNMESVAATVGPRGETLIYLLSDDNYNEAQRTLLLQLEWVDSPLVPSPPGGEGTTNSAFTRVLPSPAPPRRKLPG